MAGTNTRKGGPIVTPAPFILFLSNLTMQLHVESHAGLHDDIEPLAFQLGGKRIEVLQIIDRWIASDHGYFKIDASDGGMYILRFTPVDRQWELTLFQAPSS